MEITKTEHEVLKVIWEKSPLTAEAIIEQLNNNKAWHEKTVKTLLNRLVKKGALSFTKKGRVYDYFPLVKKEEYQDEETQSFVNRLFSGRVSPLVSGFARKEKLSKTDIDELKQFISDWEKQND